MRGIPPCAPFAGVRALLQAVASQQRAHPGDWKLLVVFTYAPDWAADGRPRLRAATTEPRARAVDTEALPGYGNLVRSLLAEAKADGAKVSALSPWNEPNHPSFISPQRATCDAHARLLSPAIYANSRERRATSSREPAQARARRARRQGRAEPARRRRRRVRRGAARWRRLLRGDLEPAHVHGPPKPA